MQGGALTRSTLAIVIATIFAIPTGAAEDRGTRDAAPARSADAEARGLGPRHGLSLFDDLKYPPDFKHFDYVNPEAPKGGTLRLPAAGTFDSLNGFIRKGRPAQGLAAFATIYNELYIYDRLTVRADDEPSTRYGLLAKTVEIAPDRSWIEFVLRQEGRWHDGKPITADDIVFTFEVLKTKGSPLWKLQHAPIPSVEKRGPYTVRFKLADTKDRQLALLISNLAVLPKHYWEGRDFEATTLEPPLGSGPYRIGRVDPGRSISYERVPDYWAKDLGVSVGQHNFDQIRMDYYLDTDVRLEAVKGGAVDHVIETVSKTWAEGYNFPARVRGDFVLELVKTQSPAGSRVLQFNLRNPKFKDRRVRQALAYAYDRAWTNQVQNHGLYEPADSYFASSQMAQTGAPSEAELALLEPFRAELPPELFEREYVMPDGSGRGRNRDNLRVAARLLKEAGYEVRSGVLVNVKTGEPFTVEILLDSAARNRGTLYYADQLRRLGIECTMRLVDTSQLLNRRRKFDFEMQYITFLMRNTPGAELRQYFTSAAAMSPNSQNYPGIASPVVDALVTKIIGARSETELIAGVRALDRVLLWSYYMIDLGHAPGWQLAYWDRFGRPTTRPRFTTGFPATWWLDAEKDASIRGVTAADEKGGAQ